jgi:hypothetical protein
MAPSSRSGSRERIPEDTHALCVVSILTQPPPPLAAAEEQHVWAYDFVQDQDMHGNTLYILMVMDEFTRRTGH